jgi:hypothetical protein
VDIFIQAQVMRHILGTDTIRIAQIFLHQPPRSAVVMTPKFNTDMTERRDAINFPLRIFMKVRTPSTPIMAM